MTIIPSQLLILAAIVVFALYVFRGRKLLIDRIVYLTLVSIGVVLALDPELSTNAANMIGIGRGADLLLYVFVLFSLFFYASLASQLKSIERQITEIVRANAINHPVAIAGGEPSHSAGCDGAAGGRQAL